MRPEWHLNGCESSTGRGPQADDHEMSDSHAGVRAQGERVPPGWGRRLWTPVGIDKEGLAPGARHLGIHHLDPDVGVPRPGCVFRLR